MNSYLQKYSDSEASFLKKRLQQHVLTLYVSTTLAYLTSASRSWFCTQVSLNIFCEVKSGWLVLKWTLTESKKKKKVNVPIKKWKEKNNNFSEVNKGVWVQEF